MDSKKLGAQTAAFSIPPVVIGHGNVVGLGQALSQEAKHLEIYQGKNEQGMAQAAVAFAKDSTDFEGMLDALLVAAREALADTVAAMPTDVVVSFGAGNIDACCGAIAERLMKKA